MRTAGSCGLAGAPKVLSCRNSSPGATPRRRAERCPPLARQALLQPRPAHIGIPQEAPGLGGEGIAVFLAAEQVKPLPRNQPEPRIAGKGDAPRQVDRVVAAELGPVNIRMGHKRSAIALVAETPDRAGL